MSDRPDVVYELFAWTRTSATKPTPVVGRKVLTYTPEWGEVRIVDASQVRDYPQRFPWWSKITTPKPGA